LCDNGDRYLNTYHDAAWVQAQFGDCSTAQARLSALMGWCGEPPNNRQLPSANGLIPVVVHTAQHGQCHQPPAAHRSHPVHPRTPI